MGSMDGSSMIFEEVTPWPIESYSSTQHSMSRGDGTIGFRLPEIL